MTDMVDHDPLSAIVRGVDQDLETIFAQITLAGEEIDRAIVRHAARRDTLYHSFTLLYPTPLLIDTEFVYRSHCRELLDRVATGADTRPATAAEVCCLCREISLVAPLRPSAMGLYLRMWSLAFPDKAAHPDQGQHYEALRGPRIDQLEALARRKLTVPRRMLGSITCSGRHDGEPVNCAYAHGRGQLEMDYDG
jgi:hypothetical protein